MTLLEDRDREYERRKSSVECRREARDGRDVVFDELFENIEKLGRLSVLSVLRYTRFLL